jgi:hypothetical protein
MSNANQARKWTNTDVEPIGTDGDFRSADRVLIRRPDGTFIEPQIQDRPDEAAVLNSLKG